MSVCVCVCWCASAKFHHSLSLLKEHAVLHFYAQPEAADLNPSPSNDSNG